MYASGAKIPLKLIRGCAYLKLCLIVQLVLFIASFSWWTRILPQEEHFEEWPILWWLSLFVMVFAVVFTLIEYHACWKFVQMAKEFESGIPSSERVIFSLLIPLYNVYYWFYSQSKLKHYLNLLAEKELNQDPAKSRTNSSWYMPVWSFLIFAIFNVFVFWEFTNEIGNNLFIIPIMISIYALSAANEAVREVNLLIDKINENNGIITYGLFFIRHEFRDIGEINT